MKLITHGLAVGVGYLLGRSDGRARLAQAGRRVTDLARRPEVVRVRERGQDLVKNQAQAVKQKVATRSTDAGQEPGVDDGRPDVMPTRRGQRVQAWRSRFSRSKGAHFPSSAEARAAQLGEAAAVENPDSPLPGVAATSRPETPAAPTR